MNVHKKKMHGIDTLKKKKSAKLLTVIKSIETISRSGSVSSISDLSPPPKKVHNDVKELTNSKNKVKKVDTVEDIEHSGFERNRASDQKVDIGTQCIVEKINVSDSQEIGELKEDLKLAKEEISQMKAEKEELKNHNKRKFNGYETEYNDLLLEKNQVLEELVTVQNEKDLALAKLDSLQNLNDEKEVDECIKEASCDGDCEHVGCNVRDAQRLQQMKHQGGRKTSPAEEVSQSLWFRCPQCNFTFRNESDVDKHVKRHHANPSCNICHMGFFQQGALRRHMQDNHNKKQSGVIKNQQGHTTIFRAPVTTRGPCIFFLQPRGCKKGSSCDFSHDTNQRKHSKIPKLCFNGPACSWKPGCRYIHPEDGESIPVRTSWEEGRRSRGKPCHWSAADCPREGPATCIFIHSPQQDNSVTETQGFGERRLSQPSPSYSMTEYPVLGQAQRPSVIRKVIPQ